MSWSDLFVSDSVIRALQKHNLTDPTPIQLQVLPRAIRDRADILGAAPTVSQCAERAICKHFPL